MYFALFRLQFNVNYNTERFVNRFKTFIDLAAFEAAFVDKLLTLQIFKKTLCSVHFELSQKLKQFTVI